MEAHSAVNVVLDLLRSRRHGAGLLVVVEVTVDVAADPQADGGVRGALLRIVEADGRFCAVLLYETSTQMLQGGQVVLQCTHHLQAGAPRRGLARSAGRRGTLGWFFHLLRGTVRQQ